LKICRNKWIKKRSCYIPRCIESQSSITTEVFSRNERDEAVLSNFYYKRVLKNGEVANCPNLICSASKIESVAATANVLALDVQSHFTQYLQRGDILVIHELIMALSVEVCWRGETGGSCPRSRSFT